MNVLTQIYNLIAAHPWWVLLLYLIYSTVVGTLKAPTASSSQFYISLFAVLNMLSVQFGRMFPKVENSPNFEPAVNLQQKMAGQEQTAVKVPPTVEDIKPPADK
jgi:hypothetical protein